MCCSEQILEATPHKTAAVWLLTSHLTNLPRKKNKTCEALLEQVAQLAADDIYIYIYIHFHMAKLNLPSVLDHRSPNCWKRTTTIVTEELERLQIDIIALLEIWLSKENQLTEVSSGYWILWVGKPNGFAVKTTLVKFLEFPSSVNDCIMKLKIQLQCGRHATILCLCPNPPSWWRDCHDFLWSVSYCCCLNANL